MTLMQKFCVLIFLSTLSLRRATSCTPHSQRSRKISIHALLAESDVAPVLAVGRAGYFYPRSPCGERPFINCNSNFTQKFLSTLSLRRATRPIFFGLPELHFYPRSPCGERRAASDTPAARRNFYPRSPCGERPLLALLRDFLHYNFYPRSPCGERQESQQPCGRPTTNFYPRSPCGERQADPKAE